METTETTHEQDRLAVEQIAASREKIEQELGRVIIGQKAAVEEILVTLFAGGNCLITGVPGLAKTLMVRAIAGIFDLEFHRIQFTPDLMPADITGTEILTDGEHGRELRFVKGPVFTNVLRPAGRRDQPHAAQDAGRAARGDAGKTGDRRRHKP